MRTVLRRVAPAAEQPAGDAADGYRFSGWVLDATARRLHDAAGREVSLTTGEFDLLHFLVQNPNRVVSRDTLLQATRHREAGAYDRAIDMQVIRLRRKIEPDPNHPVLVQSVRGVGYVFATTVERVAR